VASCPTSAARWQVLGEDGEVKSMDYIEVKTTVAQNKDFFEVDAFPAPSEIIKGCISDFSTDVQL
jgi:hypothetical protein